MDEPGDTDRRRMRRLPASVDVALRVTSGLLHRGRQLSAAGFDFNRYGMGFFCARPLRPGTQLIVDIRASHMTLRQVRAFVVSCLRTDSEFRIGVRFQHRLTELHEPGPGHPLHFLRRLEESLEAGLE